MFGPPYLLAQAVSHCKGRAKHESPEVDAAGLSGVLHHRGSVFGAPRLINPDLLLSGNPYIVPRQCVCLAVHVTSCEPRCKDGCRCPWFGGKKVEACGAYILA